MNWQKVPGQLALRRIERVVTDGIYCSRTGNYVYTSCQIDRVSQQIAALREELKKYEGLGGKDDSSR